MEAAMALVQQQLPDRVIAQPELGLIEYGPGQPAAQQTPAHDRRGGVDHAQQAMGLVGDQAGLQFQVAPGNGVDLQVLMGLFQLRTLEVRQPRLLSIIKITDQGPERADRRIQSLKAQRAQIGAGVLPPDGLLRAGLFEMPVGAPAQANLPRQFRPLLK